MKKGYFFVLDAFIAMSVIIISLILIFSFQSQKPRQMQGIFYSDDVLDLLSTTKVYEVNDPFVFSLYSNGNTNITNIQNSLLEQITEFYITDQQVLAESFVLTVTNNMVAEKIGFEFLLYNKTSRYNLTINSGNKLQNESETLIVSKKIILGLLNDQTTWGPLTAEVRVWR